MTNVRDYLKPKYLFPTIFVLFLLLTIPLTVISTLTTRDNRSKAATTVNDPCFTTDCSGVGTKQWYLTNIHAPEAWDITKGSTAIKVAVVDTGIKILPDLVGQVGTGINIALPGGSTQDSYGSYGSGTGIAGMIGAATNNNLHVAGINWNTTLLPVLVCAFTSTEGGCTVSSLASGINWAVANGAQVIVTSMTFQSSTPELDSAVANAISHNVIVVAAGGGVAALTFYPAHNPGVISVGATDQNNVIGSFSSLNPTLVAPGQQVPVLVTGGCCSVQTGTGKSAAQVAGAAALLLAAGIPASQVQTALIQGATDLGPSGYDSQYGNGLLNICGALNAAGKTCPVGSAPVINITSPTAGSSVYGSVPVKSAVTSSLAISKVELYVDGNLTGTSTTSPYTISWNTTQVANTTHPIYTKTTDSANKQGISPTISVTVNNADTDHDGYPDLLEQALGTSPTQVCSPPDSWPPDVDRDGKVNILDISKIAAIFGAKAGDPNYIARYDLNQDGSISILDLSSVAAYFGSSCTNPVKNSS